jgi:hypothetical protein
MNIDNLHKKQLEFINLNSLKVGDILLLTKENNKREIEFAQITYINNFYGWVGVQTLNTQEKQLDINFNRIKGIYKTQMLKDYKEDI